MSVGQRKNLNPGQDSNLSLLEFLELEYGHVLGM